MCRSFRTTISFWSFLPKGSCFHSHLHGLEVSNTWVSPNVVLALWRLHTCRYKAAVPTSVPFTVRCVLSYPAGIMGKFVTGEMRTSVGSLASLYFTMQFSLCSYKTKKLLSWSVTTTGCHEHVECFWAFCIKRKTNNLRVFFSFPLLLPVLCYKHGVRILWGESVTTSCFCRCLSSSFLSS